MFEFTGLRGFSRRSGGMKGWGSLPFDILRIITVTVFLADLAVFVVNDQLGLLILANLPSNFYGGLLGVCVFYGFFAATNLNVPAAFRIGHNMMRLDHDRNSFS